MDSLSKKINAFSGKRAHILRKGLHGLEKESLRVDSLKRLAQTPHPPYLGSALTHPYFSKDFAEAQLELITPPLESIEQAFSHLEDLHLYIYQYMKDEWLWPVSVPCTLLDKKNITLAKFGFTHEGYTKWLYRRGLSSRYGNAMQLLSGIHYSFSFSNEFWQIYHQLLQSKQSINGFVTKHYLHLVRNFLRVGWICSYLFGASPIIDKTYVDQPSNLLKSYCKDSLYNPYATSIRMSQLGYFSKIQSQNAITFNSLDEYLRDLKFMLNTPSEEFKDLGLFSQNEQIQINENILQIEAEHYARIRPKPKHTEGERPLVSLKGGVEYFETRILDLNPYMPNGLDDETLKFMHLLFVYCLFEESPPITKEESRLICENQNNVALMGRKKGLNLKIGRNGEKISLKKGSLNILEQLDKVALLFDEGDPKKLYQNALKQQYEKIYDPEKTPSAKILEDLIKKKKSFVDFTFSLAKKHKNYFLSKKLTDTTHKNLTKLVKKSLEEQSEREELEDLKLPGYEDLEVSTQALIKEAMKQDIKVCVLDRKENLIKLEKGNKKEYIKQASQTRLDPLISYFLMENKQVTKSILKERGLSVPKGSIYKSKEHAHSDYHKFSSKKVVVKPNGANMGEGISFVEKNQSSLFLKALSLAEAHQSQIVVEAFCPGDEYRFLVINEQVEAVCKRLPAHIEGDAKHSISELIKLKNSTNEAKASFQKKLKISKGEKEYLLKQGFQINDIPKKNTLVFLKQNSNVSTGGESIDMTDEMPTYYKKIALSAASAVGAQICGIDMLITSLKKKPDKSLYSIIELNFNPALYLHRFPSKGKKRRVERAILKALGF